MKYATLNVAKYILLLLLIIGIIPILSAQCASFESFPEGVKKGRQTHVLYRDFVKNKQYGQALPLWEQLIQHSPGGSVLYYIDGIEMMKHFIEQTTNEKEKAAYTQRIVDLYEQRIQCWSPKRKDELSVRESMVYDMYVLDYDATKTLHAFEKVIQMSKGKPAAYLLESYVDFALYLFSNDLLEKKYVLDLYNNLLKVTESNIKRNESDKKEYKEAELHIQQAYEPFEPNIFDCEYFVKKLIPVFEENYDNLEKCKDIKVTLKEKYCLEEESFLVEVKQRIKVLQDSLMFINRSNWVKGKEAEKAKNYPLAIDFYFKSIEEKDANVPVERVYYQIAQNYYALDDKVKARQFALEAAEANSNWGKPYILIGKLYAASVQQCKGRFQGRSVYWIAVDMWQKAKRTDDLVSNEANQLIQTYSKYFPDKESAHQFSIKDGSSYRIGCWIQRTTTVRTISKY